jgi:PIN domain nuclease of toxin-antitoxin system
MRVLIDTHVFLWAYAAPARLSPSALSILENDSVEKLFSAASAWEIATKWAKGALDLPEPPTSLVPRKVAEAGFRQVSITIQDALMLSELPFHHKDPFDRLLVAQALRNNARILTKDKIIARYDVDVIALWLDEDDE